MTDAIVFMPDQRRMLRDQAAAAVLFAIVGPAVLIWRAPEISVAWIPPILVLGLAVLFAPPLWAITVRGLDTIGVNDDGIVVSRLKGSFRLEWSRVKRVVRFKDRIILEGAGGRRATVFLIGHDHQDDAIVAVIKLHAELRNLAWLETLGRFGGLVR